MPGRMKGKPIRNGDNRAELDSRPATPCPLRGTHHLQDRPQIHLSRTRKMIRRRKGKAMRISFPRDPVESSSSSWDTTITSFFPDLVCLQRSSVGTLTVYRFVQPAETHLENPSRLGVDAEAFVSKISMTGPFAGSKVARVVPRSEGPDDMRAPHGLARPSSPKQTSFSALGVSARGNQARGRARVLSPLRNGD